MNQTPNTKIKIHRKKAFTLVELIIVITILAILATVAFVSFNWYTKSSRDANRLVTLTNLEKWLNLAFVSTSRYPVPDESINITDSGTTIGYQWVFGENVSSLIKASKVPTDPLDGEKYVYSINSLRKKYQLMTFLEAQNSMNSPLSLEEGFRMKAYADYSKRFPIVQWDNLWIILDQNNIPVKIDIVLPDTSNTVRKWYCRNEVKNGTWIILTALKTTYTKMWKEVDKNCDIEDIIIWDQIWAGCNSTLGQGVEWGKKDDGTDGWIADCFNYAGVNLGIINCPVATSRNSMISSAKEKSWIIASWVSGVQDNIWWKFYTWDNSPSACPSWWHVPSEDEWAKMENYLYGWICRWWDVAQCSGLWWMNNYTKNATNNIIQVLKIPLSGGRDVDGNMFRNRWNSAYLWTSTSGYNRFFNYWVDTVDRYNIGLLYWFSTRCIKD